MADITHIFKATLKTIQTRNKALGRIHREGSQGPTKDGNSPSPPPPPALSSSPTMDPLSILFANHLASNGAKNIGANAKGGKSDFNVRAKDIIVKITKLRDFLLRHRMDYINIHSHLIFEQVRSMSDAERDQVDNNAQAVMRSCGEEIRCFRSDMERLKLLPQLEEHRSITINMIDNYLKSVCKIFSEMKAVRVKRVLDRKRLSRIGGDAVSKKWDAQIGAQHKRLKVDNDEVGQKPATTGESNDAPPTDEIDDAEVEADDEMSGGNSPTTLNEAVSERGGNASTTWASTSFDDDDAERVADNLSAEEIQMFEQENAFLIDELQNTTDDVQKIEGQVIEIARLQEIFSEKILQQEDDISRIGENLTGTTENLQMANEQIREAIKNNAGFRVWILFFLVVMTFSLLFLDWYND